MQDSRMRVCRKKAGLKAVEAARMLELTQASISQYQVGKRVPSVDVLIRMADLYGVSMDYLIGRSDVDNNDVNDELIRRFDSLPQGLKRQALAYAAGLLKTEGDPSSCDHPADQ